MRAQTDSATQLPGRHSQAGRQTQSGRHSQAGRQTQSGRQADTVSQADTVRQTDTVRQVHRHSQAGRQTQSVRHNDCHAIFSEIMLMLQFSPRARAHTHTHTIQRETWTIVIYSVGINWICVMLQHIGTHLQLCVQQHALCCCTVYTFGHIYNKIGCWQCVYCTPIECSKPLFRILYYI